MKTKKKEMGTKKGTAMENVQKAAVVAIVMETCFLTANAQMGFFGRYGRDGIEIVVYVVFTLICFATTFFSLSLYKTDIAPKRWLNLMMISFVVITATILIISPLGKGYQNTMNAMFQPSWIMLCCVGAMVPCLIATLILNYWSRKVMKGLLVISGLTCGLTIMFAEPTLGQQVDFREWGWKLHPKVRYYMAESVVDSLRKGCPNRAETLEMLGKADFESQKNLTYELRNNSFIIGFDLDVLKVNFDAQGQFVNAYITNWD